jgi:hypothetical protein
MRRSYVIAAAIAIVAGGWLATGQLQNGGEAPAAPTRDQAAVDEQVQADGAMQAATGETTPQPEKLARVRIVSRQRTAALDHPARQDRCRPRGRG